MNFGTEQIFMPSCLGMQALIGLQKPADRPPVNLENVRDFSNVCRVCAAVTEQVMPIFSGEGLQNNLADKINKYLPVKVQLSDSPKLPVVVCYQCASTLLATHELVQCSAQADSALRVRSGALHGLQKTKSPTSTSSRNSKQPSCSNNEPNHSTTRPSGNLGTGLSQNSSTGSSRNSGAGPSQDSGTEPSRDSDTGPSRDVGTRPGHGQCTGPCCNSSTRTSIVPSRDSGNGSSNTDETDEEEVEVRCAYCPAAMPTPRYWSHLLAHHKELVFHCADCDSLVSRRMFLIHMATHLAQYDEDEARERARAAGLPLARGPPTPAQELAAMLREQLYSPDRAGRETVHAPVRRPARPVVHVKTERPTLPLTDITRELTTTGNSSVATAAPVKRERRSTSVFVKLERLRAIAPGPAPPAGGTPSPEPPVPVVVPGPAPPASEAEADEFSDHSDAEGGFGPLPDSVFTAIEDSQEAPPRATRGRAAQDEKRERTCPHCSKTYRAASSYFYHLKYFHKRSKEHSCGECGARFGTRGALRDHASRHTAERALQCADCGKRFRSRASLYIHKQTHGAEKKWSCAECGLAFRWRAQLRRHTARHTGARAHSCAACPRAFSVRADLLRHVRTHARAQHACPVPKCTALFAQPRYLRAHLAKKHPDAPRDVA